MGLAMTALTCLALNIYHEARGEPVEGQIAVAQVTLNRVASPAYPDTVCDVVWQRSQFSWTGDGRSDRPRERGAWVQAIVVAARVKAGMTPDVVGGALHYHADYVSPRWARAYVEVARIGRHVFYEQQQEG